MSDLTPRTRTEMLLDGQDLTPVTRKEMFLRRLYDETQEVPEPITREEWFLNKAAEGSGGDVTVVPLSVTSNGTYSEEGKAYSPVTVAVEPPPHSYQLKSITTPTSLATFTAAELPLNKLKVAINAVQDLHGYDHPWVGGAGINIFDASWEYGSYGSGGNKINDDTRIRTVGAINVSPNTTYIFNMSSYHETGNLLCYFSEDAFLSRISIPSNQAFTTPENCTRITLSLSLADDGLEPKVQLEKGNVMHDWSPYSNICPISGWDEAKVSNVGKNLCNKADFNTTQALVYKPIYVGEGNFTFSTNCPPTTGTTVKDIFIIGGSVDTGADSATNGVSSTTPRTVTAVDGYITIASRYNSARNNPADYDWMLVKGSEVATYEPYNGVTTTISFGQTVYGGELDVVNGGGSNTHGFRQGFTRGALDSSGKLYKLSPILDDVAVWSDTSGASTKIMSNMFEVMSLRDARTATTPSLSQHETSFYVGGYVGDEATLDALLSNLQIKYELSTPTTLTTQPTPIKSLDGVNNLSADCGEILEGEYFKALGGE